MAVESLKTPEDTYSDHVAGYRDVVVLIGLIAMTVILLFAFEVSRYSAQAETYRKHAMDLCAWHARRMYGDDPASAEATARWRRIVAGEVPCSFCGSRHDENWISRAAWDAQLNALSLED